MPTICSPKLDCIADNDPRSNSVVHQRNDPHCGTSWLHTGSAFSANAFGVFANKKTDEDSVASTITTQAAALKNQSQLMASTKANSSRGPAHLLPPFFLFWQETFSVPDGLTASRVTKNQTDEQQTASDFLTPWKLPPPMIVKFCSLSSGAGGLIQKMAIVSVRTI